ncbi:30S ribosomal protein S19e [Haloferax larsenii]|uniref:Small ribosomal subunit protein eS19 n=1 Tax=Haloferax larsenii TaxID=302484 RepID=A0ABY5RFW9_HALLR|nr:30S ribosomal protein S19e [Haloferax larsenii]ELZ79792.1 30S ribosomal protein S19e [Haloferax larsenii JCM 13917]UVE50935.1 30S ribosomal protein S19e [Haloferax larsenii]
MVTIYDVPADALIEEVAGRLEDRIEQPDWMAFAKTGQTRELPPQQDNFWFIRGASLLRKVAMNGPVGVDRLSTEYGGRKRGSNRYRVAGTHSDSSGKKIIRTLLQQLEEEGLIETAKGEGRRITAEGTSFLDNAASDVLADLDRPELERYA